MENRFNKSANVLLQSPCVTNSVHSASKPTGPRAIAAPAGF